MLHEFLSKNADSIGNHLFMLRSTPKTVGGTARLLSTANWVGRWGGSPLNMCALGRRLDPEWRTCGVSCLIVVVDG